MVLQADVASTRVVLVCNVELVFEPSGRRLGIVHSLKVHPGHEITVELDGDLRSIAGDDHVIPLTSGFMAFFEGFTRS